MASGSYTSCTSCDTACATECGALCTGSVMVNPNLDNGREHRVGAELYPWQYNDTVDTKYFVRDIISMIGKLYYGALAEQDAGCAIDRIKGTMADFVRDHRLNTKYGLSYNSYTLEIPLYNINFFSTLLMKRLNPRIYTMEDMYNMHDLFEQRILFFIDGKFFSKLKIYAEARKVMLIIDADESSIDLDVLKSFIENGYDWTLLTIPFSATKKYIGDGSKVCSSNGLYVNKLRKASAEVQADKNYWLVGYTTDRKNTGLKDFILTSMVGSSGTNSEYIPLPDKIRQEIRNSSFVDIEIVSIPNAKGSIRLGTGRSFQIKLDKNPVPPQNIFVWEYFSDTETYEFIHNAHVALYYPNVYVVSEIPEDADILVSWCYSDKRGREFDNPLKEYMEYDTNYAGHVIGGDLPEIVRNYMPYVEHYSDRDYLDYMDQATRWHEYPYKLSTIKELVNENPDRLKEIYEKYEDRTAYDWHANPHYTIKMSDWGSYENRKRTNNYNEISVGKHEEFNGVYMYFTLDHEDDRVYPVDVWIDGVYISTPYQYTENYRTWIYIPVSVLKPNSIIEFEIMKVREENSVTMFIDMPAIHNSIALPRGFFKDISPQNILMAVRDETVQENGERLFIYNMANDYNMYWFLIGHTKYVNGIPMKSFEISMRNRKAVMCNLLTNRLARYIYCDRIIIGDSYTEGGNHVRICTANSDHKDCNEWQYTRIDEPNPSFNTSDGILQNDVTWRYIGLCNNVTVKYIEEVADNRPLFYGNVVYPDGSPAFDYMVKSPDSKTLCMGDRESLLIIINDDNTRTYLYCDKITFTEHYDIENRKVTGYTMLCESEDGLTFQWTLIGEVTWRKDGIVHNVSKVITNQKFFAFGKVYNSDGELDNTIVSPISTKVYAKSILTDDNNVILLQDTNVAIMLDEYHATENDDEYFIERGYPWDSYYIVKSSIYADYAETNERVITLSASGWVNKTQEIAIDIVTDDCRVIVTPDAECENDYITFVKFTGHSAGKLTFTCRKEPTKDIILNITTYKDSGFDDPYRVGKLGYYGETRRRFFKYLPYSDNDPTIYLTPITNHFAGKRVRIQSTDIYKKWTTYLPKIPRDGHHDEDRRIVLNDFRLDPAISKFRVFLNGRICDHGYDWTMDVNTNEKFILGTYVNIGIRYDPDDPTCAMRYLTRNSNEMVVEYLPYKYDLLYRFQPNSQTINLRTSIIKRPFSLRYYDVYVNGIKCTEDDIEINTASKITLKMYISEDTVVSFYARRHDPEVYGNRTQMIESLNDAFAKELKGFRDHIYPKVTFEPTSRDVANCVGCSTTCGTTCVGDCTNACYGCTSVCTGCTGSCVSQCKNACANMCGESCESACNDTCKNDCQKFCGVGCTSYCTGACANTCVGSCTNSCIGMSTENPICSGCSTMCVGCQGDCTSTCIGTCLGSCVGQEATIPSTTNK